MSINKTWAISSWISFLISADMFRWGLGVAGCNHLIFSPCVERIRSTISPRKVARRRQPHCSGRRASCGKRIAADTAASTGLLRLGFRDEFLETRVTPERIKHRVEPEQRRSKELRAHSQCASIRYREQFL